MVAILENINLKNKFRERSTMLPELTETVLKSKESNYYCTRCMNYL